MQYKFFVIPIKSNDDAAEEMNRFLRGHRILALLQALYGIRELYLKR